MESKTRAANIRGTTWLSICSLARKLANGLAIYKAPRTRDQIHLISQLSVLEKEGKKFVSSFPSPVSHESSRLPQWGLHYSPLPGCVTQAFHEECDGVVLRPSSSPPPGARWDEVTTWWSGVSALHWANSQGMGVRGDEEQMWSHINWVSYNQYSVFTFLRLK